MKQAKYLFKRNKIFYFRFPSNLTNAKLSLQTSDYYEACFLRDRILNRLAGSITMANDNPYKINNSELIKESARKILERETKRNNGKLFFSNKEIKKYLPEGKIIKDQEFLEECIQRKLLVIEQERVRNGGKLPEYIVDDLKRCTQQNTLYGELTEDTINYIEQIQFTSSSDGGNYIPKDSIELFITFKEVLFNIAVEYLSKHYSPPTTPANQENYNKLIQLGIIQNKDTSVPKATQTGSNIPQPEINNNQSSNPIITLSQVVNEYINEKKVSSDTKSNTLEDAVKMLNLAMEFLGKNTDINEANNRPLLLEYKKTLKSIPINRNKTNYKNKSIKELAKITTDAPKMSVATSNKYLMYLTSLFKYAEERDYITKSQAYRLQDKNRVHPRDQNDRFSSEELVILFSKLKEAYGNGDKQEKLWIPLISLFTSCRLNEICQLTFNDLIKKDNISCFKITTEDDNDNKSLKTVYSHRILPIHKTLIDLGLIEYIQKRKQKAKSDNDNMWGLKYEDARNKYGRTVGRTFNELRKILFKPPPRRKTFHSLRHTFATFFRKVTDNELVMYFDGHSSKNQTFGRYAKYDDYKWIKSEIDKLKYSPEVEKIFKSWIK